MGPEFVDNFFATSMLVQSVHIQCGHVTQSRDYKLAIKMNFPSASLTCPYQWCQVSKQPKAKVNINSVIGLYDPRERVSHLAAR